MQALNFICESNDLLLTQLTSNLCRVVRSDVVSLVVDAPLNILGLVYSPDVYSKAQVVALFNPLGICLHNLEAVVDTGVTQILAVLGCECAVKVSNLDTFGTPLNQLVANVLTESDVLHVVNQLELLDHLQYVFHNACLA